MSHSCNKMKFHTHFFYVEVTKQTFLITTHNNLHVILILSIVMSFFFCSWALTAPPFYVVDLTLP